MSPVTCRKRMEALVDSRLDALKRRSRPLESRELAAASSEPRNHRRLGQGSRCASRRSSVRQRKALIRKLVKELAVMRRDEITPTHRIPGLVRAPGSSGDQWVSGPAPVVTAVRHSSEVGGLFSTGATTCGGVSLTGR